MDGIQFEDMHTQLKSAEWKWFLASTRRDKNNRRHAKCKQCDKVMTGRLEFMRKHLLHECNQLSATEKATYMQETQSLPGKGVGSSQVSNSSQQSEATSTLATSRKRPATGSLSQYFPTVATGERKKVLDKAIGGNYHRKCAF
jgi:hypothetical protein